MRNPERNLGRNPGKNSGRNPGGLREKLREEFFVNRIKISRKTPNGVSKTL